MFGSGFVILLQKKYQEILPFLDRYKAPPAGASVAARDLTQAQARDLVIHHHHNQHLTLEKWPEFDAQGTPTYPKVGGKVRIGFAIGGVQYVADNPDARGWELTNPIDQRFAVFLVRLSQWLGKQWGTSVVNWGGIGVGGDATQDQHSKGFALDFHGAVTRHGAFNVWRDWGAKPVPTAIGGVKGRWPGNATKTSHRMAVDPLDLARLVTTPPAALFFRDLYNFLWTQALHGSLEAGPRIGQVSSILHPDTPTPYLRGPHQDHFHVEIDR